MTAITCIQRQQRQQHPCGIRSCIILWNVLDDDVASTILKKEITDSNKSYKFDDNNISGEYDHDAINGIIKE